MPANRSIPQVLPSPSFRSANTTVSISEYNALKEDHEGLKEEFQQVKAMIMGNASTGKAPRIKISRNLTV
ncbi:hypothetical protein ABG067_007807, partial [Albugo candida]